jgi:hypothetical protein
MNLIKALEESLRHKYAAEEIEPLLAPFPDLAEKRDLWNHALDGLAVLAAPGMFRVYRLQRRVPEIAVAADSFHTKPLLRILQSADRYQILGLTRQEIKLFEGNRDAVDEITLAPGVPRTIVEALGEETTEPRLTVSSYGGSDSGMFHGHGGRKDEVNVDAERFFRAVDRAVLRHHSRPSELPLLLAALPDNQAIFRRITHNPLLLPEGIDFDPQSLSEESLRERAWQVLEPHYIARLAKLVEAFAAGSANGLGTDDLARAAEAATAGRVESLLVEADRRIPGRIDAATGRVTAHDLRDPQIDDALDDLAELVQKRGGRVVVVPAERMPTSTGHAAVFRY